MKVLFFEKNTIITIIICIGALMLIGGLTPLGSDEQAVSGQAGKPPYYCGDLTSTKISLAINVDWGEEYLADLIRLLADQEIEATFFLTGRWCDNNPKWARAIAEAGHELGNHGYSHSSPNAASINEIIAEIKKTEDSILKVTDCKTKLYAPPSGESEPHVIKAASQAGYQTILWSVDTIDWQKPDAKTIIDRVKNKIHGGAIILAHPTASTVEALIILIDDLQEEGYQFAKVSENLNL